MHSGPTNRHPGPPPDRALRLLRGQRSASSGRQRLPRVLRRRAHLRLLRDESASKNRSWPTIPGAAVGFGTLAVALVLLTALLVHVAGTNSRSVTKSASPDPAHYSQAAYAAVLSLLPAIVDTRAAFQALNTGDLERARQDAHLAVAVAVAARARVAVLVPPPSQQETNRLLRRGVESYVSALKRARDAMDRGDLFGALQASGQIGDAEGDLLLATNGGAPPAVHRITSSAPPSPMGWIRRPLTDGRSRSVQP